MKTFINLKKTFIKICLKQKGLYTPIQDTNTKLRQKKQNQKQTNKNKSKNKINMSGQRSLKNKTQADAG